MMCSIIWCNNFIELLWVNNYLKKKKRRRRRTTTTTTKNKKPCLVQQLKKKTKKKSAVCNSIHIIHCFTTIKKIKTELAMAKYQTPKLKKLVKEPGKFVNCTKNCNHGNGKNLQVVEYVTWTIFTEKLH